MRQTNVLSIEPIEQAPDETGYAEALDDPALRRLLLEPGPIFRTQRRITGN